MEEEGEIEISLGRQALVTAVFSAVGLILGETPLGYIKIGGTIEITLVHIPAILAVIFGGLLPGVFSGLVFGLSSFMRNLLTANSFGNFFINPMVSILPRLLFPAVTHLVYKSLSSLPHVPKIACGIIASAVGTFSHTLLVMMSIFAFYGETFLRELSRRGEIEFNSGGLPGMRAFLGMLWASVKHNAFLEIALALFAVAIGFAVLHVKDALSHRSFRLI